MQQLTDSLSSLRQVGDRLTVTVNDLAFGGEGVARVDGFVVFVPLVLPGEEAEIELVEVKKRFARGRLLQVLKTSPARVTPPCRYFGLCGGCQYQHQDYPDQLRLKQKQVADILERLGKLNPAVVKPGVPCPQPYAYRNRIMIRSQWNKIQQRLDLGFLRADSRLVVDLEECLIADPEVNRQLTEARAHPPSHGGLKVVLRSNPPDWEIPWDSFFQNNTPMLPRLVEVVQGCLAASGTRHLVDAYCGVGFFSLELAGAVESFIGIEYDRLAVAAARHNAARRQRTNGEFIQGKTEDHLGALLAQRTPAATTVVLDPPRTGCARAGLEVLRQTRPAQILYVSCQPATLARDLNALCAGGVYQLVEVIPLDMFPQTQHVECVADLRVGPEQTLAGWKPAPQGAEISEFDAAMRRVASARVLLAWERQMRFTQGTRTRDYG